MVMKLAADELLEEKRADRMWGTIEDEGDSHVIPTNDLMGHITSRTCACKPRRVNSKIFVHNSFDLREEEQ